MARKQKTGKSRTGKQRNILRLIFSGLWRLLCWLATLIYHNAQKNPLMSFGFFLFMIGFGFVTYNALFVQTASHHSVFIQTRPLPASMQETVRLSNPSGGSRHDSDETNVVVNDKAVDPQAIQANNYSELADNLLDAQKKLATLGFYDGPLDGLDGPKTRSAIMAWKSRSVANTSASPAANRKTDDIASLIAGETPEASNVQKATVDNVTTQSLEREKHETSPTNMVETSQQKTTATGDRFEVEAVDIMRVQAGLKAFGNDQVMVTGKEDDITAEALRQFQKMFSLSVTGKINREVLDKMRDIGLIG